MTEKQTPDWELIETLYRAGILSVREIGAAQGVSHTAIQKKAKAGSWERDLKAKIKAKADALVAKAEVAKQVAIERVATEQGIVEGNAQVVADIRMAHRKDISRSRRLAIKLLEELEGMTDERATLQELIAQLKDGEDADTAMLDLATKMMSLPNRTKIMKEIAESLRVLIALERQAYSIDDTTSEESYEDRLARLMRDGA
ncbi:hypothetical protein [Pseudomonas viridiflava]|uniref:hypothetical protein n=1 Tax=Pseudomonas viridiflava TaxID=33069 RepID=UPI002E99D85B|nr:hypothetical protein [Pseudomonas viridiflava]